MPDQSGVVQPSPRPKHRLSDNYFTLEHDDWVPQILNDPKLPALILEGGKRLPLLYEELSQSKQIVQQQRAQRKTETEAIVPHFADLRAEAHYRFNRLARLRHAYLQAVPQVLPDRSNLPLDFSYDEGDSTVISI